MKKLIPATFFTMLLCTVCYADSMKFITVLSSPVGTFNKLESVDPSRPAYGTRVNFCTRVGTEGLVELKGSGPAQLNTVRLLNATTLGKTDEGKYSLSRITLQDGGSIRGGRLFGNVLEVNNEAVGKAGVIYGNELTVAGAKTKKLDVNGGESHIDTQHAAAEMVWSNEYQSDTACGNTASCAKQYLLKEKRAVSVNKCPQTAGDPRTWWDESTQQCGCPNANEYYHNGACCSEATSKTNTKCWKKSTLEGDRLVWKNVLASEHFITQNIANQGITSFTCSTGGALGFTGNPKTIKPCPHYSCSGSCVLQCNPLGGGGSGPLTPTPNPTPSTGELGPCTKEGDICVAQLHISINDSECFMGKFLWCATTYTYSSCVKSAPTTSYQRLWDILTDTRYGCGH